MSDQQGVPAVAGYTQQSEHNVALVNHFKVLEERLLREIDVMRDTTADRFDRRWLSIAETHFQQGFMSLARSVFRPERIALPGDEKPE